MQNDKPPSHIKYSRDYVLLNDMNTYFSMKLYKRIPYSQYNTFSIIDKNDNDRIHFSTLFSQMKKQNTYKPQKLKLSSQHSRGIASLLGLSIADALGASTQFIPYQKERKGLIVDGFQDVKQRIKDKILDARSGKVGIWTDDCSMALCMADSLLLKFHVFDPIHIRYMFIMWLQHGLNNGGRPHSIGLGGNIAISMNQFMKDQTKYAIQGDKFNNGNGSLMRLAPIPLLFSNLQKQAIHYSGQSSMTTHNGQQAKQCCKLLALILVRLINRPDDANWKQVLQKACEEFKSDVKSVQYLAKSLQETKEMYQASVEKYQRKFTKFNKQISDRNWNWKDKNFTYSQTRNKQQPGYIGSYCMDALSMALHMVWHTKNFKEMVIWSANMGGDCDTVGAIAGQIAGAIYGVDQNMLKLYSEMQDFQAERYDVFLKGYKLACKKQLQEK